ncbi:MAG: radical SAM protein [Acidobacteriota bacterium]|jgi:uncharacterized radical SAM superfamily Fe-S cluster-containing enzyme|nr:radical SAM protein [Acidobacteriota bacterium]
MTDTTESLCPQCLRRVPARRAVEGGDVYLHRSCPEHGPVEKVLIWRNGRVPLDLWTRPRAGACCPSSCDCTPAAAGFAKVSLASLTLDAPARRPGCPYSCGICPGHRQSTCSALVEVTSRCNLRCPVCFADAPGATGAPAADPGVDEIEGRLRKVRASAGNCPVQFSGGEPTLRDDLPEIVRRARALGFDHVQVNTNGLRIAQDFGYAEALRDAGVTVFFLQFDGAGAGADDAHLKMRGRAMAAVKEAAIGNAAALRVAVILVPTLAKGVNDTQVGDILRFAKSRMPAVKGVHFQPMTHMGRYPRSPRNEDRILVPDLLAAIEEQTGGELAVENFIPSACEDPRCSFSALAVLGEDGRLLPTTHIDWAGARGGDAAEKSIAYIRRHWRHPGKGAPDMAPGRGGAGAASPTAPARETEGGAEAFDALLERIKNYSLCVSGMAFQDVWNIELDRLRRCCIHVAESDAALVPFCAHYLTGADGRRLRAFAQSIGGGV